MRQKCLKRAVILGENSMRIISKLEQGLKSVTVYYDYYLNEYKVVKKIAKKEVASYFTDDKQDASATASAMFEERKPA
jgi:hypothetical protein